MSGPGHAPGARLARVRHRCAARGHRRVRPRGRSHGHRRRAGRIDLAASRFRDDSELATQPSPGCPPPSRLSGRAPAGRTRCGKGHRRCGRPDPGCLAARGRLRPHLPRDSERRPAIGSPCDDKPIGRWSSSTERLTVRIPEWVELDLGATAKAYAADRAAAAAFRATGTGVLLSLGGDIAVAGPSPTDGWPILMTEDSNAPLDTPGPV